MLNKAIPFLLLPILTKYLSPEEYGLLSIFLISISLYGAFIGMSVNTNISKNYHHVTRDELAKIIGNVIFILLFTTLFYFIFTVAIWSLLDEVFSIPVWLLLAVPFLAFMQMINNLNTTILRNEQRAFMYGVFEVSKTVLVMGVTVFFLTALDFSWHSQIVGISVGSFIFCILGFIYMYKRNYITLAFDKEKIKSILHISVPLVPHVLGALIIAMSDRIFIEQMIGLEAVGLYAVGYSFGMIVMIFTDAFIKAWSPWFYKILANPTESKKQKIVKYTYIYIIGLFVLAGAISVVAKFILPYFIDEKFYGASEFIFWIALGYAIRGVYQIFFPYLVHISRTAFLATSTVVAALINLLLNYLLIDMYGAIGAAYATAGAFAISASLVFWYQQKNYYMPWLLRRKNVT
jgi:O-antigen/teichoic acid export membrane protein